MARKGVKITVEMPFWWSDADFETDEEFEAFNLKEVVPNNEAAGRLLIEHWEMIYDLISHADVSYELIEDPDNS